MVAAAAHPGGDRNTNTALHMIAVVCKRSCQRTRAFVQRRTTQGKSKADLLDSTDSWYWM